jgi:hypothetical protein
MEWGFVLIVERPAGACPVRGEESDAGQSGESGDHRRDGSGGGVIRDGRAAPGAREDEEAGKRGVSGRSHCFTTVRRGHALVALCASKRRISISILAYCYAYATHAWVKACPLLNGVRGQRLFA